MMDVTEEQGQSDTGSCADETIQVVVCPATGGQFEVEIGSNDSIDDLLKKISRHLQTPRDRLKVLFKEKVLVSGTVAEHNIQSGNRVTLLPAIESGFSSTVQGTQQSIIQAIESLSDVQIDDFLSGRSPLTLALRVGDHMMFVQLQLEQSVAQTATVAATSQPPSAPRTPSQATGSQRSQRSHRHRPSMCNQPFPPHCLVTPTSATVDALPASSYHPQSASGVLPTGVTKSHCASPEFMAPASPDGPQQSVAAVGGPTAGLLYKSTATSPTNLQTAQLPRNISREKASHIDNHVSAYSSLGGRAAAPVEAQAGKPTGKAGATTQQQQQQQQATPQAQQSGQATLKRISTTSGKITSGVGSLSHHGSPMSGTRVVRQMQRLRRLCGSHQQCVAYSSPELASEISSIVHAAKHHSSSSSTSSSGSSSDGSSGHHRRSGKGSTRDRSRPASSTTSSSGVVPRSTNPPPTGACIDSFTTHGPGIFSGTFSGSLHPNIQDKEGRPKRDPQTILQILTDLLSATNQYQGQAGNIGMLPQLLRDHFAKQQGGASPPPPTTTSSSEREQRSSRSHRSRHQPYHHHHHHHHHHPYSHQPQQNQQQQQQPRVPAYPAAYNPYLGMPQSYATYGAMGALDPAAVYQHYARSQDEASQGHRGSRKCPHRHEDQGKQAKGATLSAASRNPLCYCSFPASSSSRRSNKQTPNINVCRLMQLRQENSTTREKMRQLTEKMQQRRLRRQMRREACGPYKRGTGPAVEPAGAEDRDKMAEMSSGAPNSGRDTNEHTSLEVQIDNLRDFAEDRKAEVTHESPETVTV